MAVLVLVKNQNCKESICLKIYSYHAKVRQLNTYLLCIFQFNNKTISHHGRTTRNGPKSAHDISPYQSSAYNTENWANLTCSTLTLLTFYKVSIDFSMKTPITQVRDNYDCSVPNNLQLIFAWILSTLCKFFQG